MRRGALASLLLVLAAATTSRADPVPESLPGAPAFGAELRAKLSRALEQRPPGWEPRTRHRLPDGSPRYTNRLALEKSPYLLQHAHNPVDWHPWGDEAFATSAELGRPVFVSIGYSTCHWCHVMEEESFDDPATAELLNSHFVAIKVDREVRPDVDSIYMTALAAMGSPGGWPLNVWLTPARHPFFGGTYFPPGDSMGRPGFRSVLRTLHRIWSEKPEDVEQRAASLSATVIRVLEGGATRSGQAPRVAHLLGQVDAWHASFDRTWGGVRGREKFPATSPLRLLLRLHRRGGDARALEMATHTLERIAAGGIHDHLGGGFYRYATDPRWLVPHFEKTLYDNALLAIAFLEAWQASGRSDFERVVRRTLDYLAREMSDPAGGFYSATDADSVGPEGEAEEGRFFTWTPEEIEAVVGAEAAPLVLDWYGVTGAGEVDGRSVLHTWRTPAGVAVSHGISPELLSSRIEAARLLLFEAREQRPPPLRDAKVLTAWNGLAISAFARAGLALDVPSYTQRAVRAAEFLLDTRSDGHLPRVWIGGRAEGPAFLADHAFLIAGLLDLYEASPETRWLREALALQRSLDSRYAAAGGGYYRTTASGAEKLLAREKPVRDQALPSGNAVAALNLLRLASLTGDVAHRERADAIFSTFHEELDADPMGLAGLRIAADFALDTPKEVLLVSPEGGRADSLLDVLRSTWLPNRVLVTVSEGEELERHASLVPLLKYKKARGGEPTAYVCENRVCKLPTSDPEVFSKQLLSARPLKPPPP